MRIIHLKGTHYCSADTAPRLYWGAVDMRHNQEGTNDSCLGKNVGRGWDRTVKTKKLLQKNTKMSAFLGCG